MSAQESPPGLLAPCATCGEVPAPGARFCENCGSDVGPVVAAGDGPPILARPPVPALPPLTLPPPPPDLKPTDPESGSVPPPPPPPPPAARRPCTSCGGTVADDGYCEQCGEKAQVERDHWAEQPAPWVAGVCDRGIRHSRNEDAMALAASGDPATVGRFAALVVCDGVSAAPDSDVASLAAARAARDVLASGGPDGAAPVTGDVTERIQAWQALMVAASTTANDAVLVAVGDKAARAEPPSCTFVAAVVDGPLVVAGWVGDSRAYWIPDAGTARQLSVDDSWAHELMAMGTPRHVAENAPQAHAITRWLGPDSTDPAARCAPTVPDSSGWLLVCSDGLWNYCSAADDLADLVRSTEATTGREPRALATELVRWANAQGGRDNITATLARFEALAAPDTSDNLHTDAVSGDEPATHAL
ncbi:MAG: serine/threonine-protein phosphatase [Oerskovia sp.]|nr:serine/threonine-protein phosphatase [Oerskovia sp.]